MNEARAGNDESLFKLVKLFKDMIDDEWIKKRIAKAKKERDDDFLRRFGKALAAQPRIKKGDTQLVWWLLVQEPEKVGEMTDKQITDYLSEKFDRIYTEEAIRKTRQRLGIIK